MPVSRRFPIVSMLLAGQVLSTTSGSSSFAGERLIATSQAKLTESQSHGDSQQVADAYRALNELNSDRAIALLTRPLITALNSKTERGRQDGSRYLLLMAHAFRIDDNTTSCIRAAKQACLLDPKSILAKSFCCESLSRAGKYDQAQALLHELEPLVTKSRPVARAFGLFYMARGQLDHSQRYFNIGTQIDITDPRLHNAMANMYYGEDSAREFALAAKYCQSPYLKEMLLSHSVKATNPRKDDRTHLLAAAQILPEDPSWKLDISGRDLEQGKTKLGFEELVEAAQRPRFSRKALSVLAIYCAFHQKPKLAQQCVHRLLHINGDQPDAHWVAGQIHQILGHKSEAEKELKTAIAICPYHYGSYMALSNMSDYNQDNEKTNWLLKEWLSHNDYRFEPWLWKADWLRKREKWDEALAAYKQAQTLFRNYGADQRALQLIQCRITSGIGSCLYKTNKVEEAVEQAHRFNQIRPLDADVIKVRPGKIDFDKVRTDAKRASAANHGSLADMLFECGLLDDAVTEYNEAISLDNDIQWHRGVLKVYMDKHDWSNAAREDMYVSNHAVSNDIPNAMGSIKKKVFK